MKEISQPNQQDIVRKQVGTRKFNKAGEIRAASEKMFFDWEMKRFRHPPEKETEIRNIATGWGIQEGEDYLWPKRIKDVETSWNTAIGEDLANEEKKFPQSYSPGKIKIIMEKKIDFLLKRATTDNPENPWKPGTKYDYVVAVGMEAAKRGLVKQADIAINMLEGSEYEKGLIAAMVNDKKTVRKVVQNLLESSSRIKIDQAYKAAELGELVGDPLIRVHAIGKLRSQKSYRAAAELELSLMNKKLPKLNPMMVDKR